ncbi:hypothetical protein FOCC_FOCC013872 [Frankliniella occidentalis]|nr:hypothetical protein FOCC_FOCC013872 [Frankliniella occidentalis]
MSAKEFSVSLCHHLIKKDTKAIPFVNASKKKLNKERQKRYRANLSSDKKKAEQASAKERMRRLRKTESLNSKLRRKNDNTLRRKLARRCKKQLASSSDLPPGIDIHQHQFDVFQKSLQWYICNICNKKQICSYLDKKPCSNCNIFTLAHDLDPKEVPPELQNLSFIEQQLIARIHPVVSLYKVKNVQYKYTGQVINFPQNVQEVATDLTGVLTIRLKNSVPCRDFSINKDKVLAALIWLRKNNPFYQDVVISHERIQALPNDCSSYSLLRGYDVDESHVNSLDPNSLDSEITFLLNDDDCDDEDNLSPIVYKDVPDLSFVTQKQQLNIQDNVLLWPSIGIKPINEFSSPGYITMSFPHLFPYGTCDYSNRSGNIISLEKYVQHLMLYKDGRFATDPRFRFFMLNSMMRWQALRLGNIFVKQSSFFNKMTICQLKEYLQKHPGHVKDILFYSRRIRSTKAYWKSRCSELEDMVKQIGAPTVFFTLSSADYHWSELFRLLGYSEPNTLSYYDKSKLISENPLVVTTFFKLRLEYFLKNTFSDYFDVQDVWYRIEFQSRGSGHAHGVVWLKNAPDITKIKTEQDKQYALEYFTKLVSCQNPDISFRPTLIHPCSKCVTEVDNLDDDLTELVNRVQKHTCSPTYCLKHRNKITKTCR